MPVLYIISANFLEYEEICSDRNISSTGFELILVYWFQLFVGFHNKILCDLIDVLGNMPPHYKVG